MVTTVPKGVVRKSALNLIARRNYSYFALGRWANSFVSQTSSRSFFLISTVIGLTSITWLCAVTRGVTLEPPKIAQVPSSSQKPEGKMLFVNPAVENATPGNGSESTPFKTITQALQLAEPNSVIVLSSGTYSTSSGETFPLRLKPGVSIQGDAKTKGSKIAIKGGGIFISPTFARQNITILGANFAKITGVTVTNPNPRGYGLWIESSSPIVSDNTFTDNRHDGISITGNSAPTIRNNYFYQNGANGITIYGISRPEVRDNVFENTGFGINIAQKAAPSIIGNRIIKNRAGIVSQANSRPVLRNNTIEDNREDGVVAIAASQPDLGTKTEPGGNVFRQNGRYDINSSAAKQVISAFGNQLADARTNGNIDLAGNTSPTTIAVSQSLSKPPLVLNSRNSNNNQNQEILSGSEPRTSPPMGEGVQTSASRKAAIPAIAPIEIPVPLPEITTRKPAILNNPPRQVALRQSRKLPPKGSSISASDHKLPTASGSDSAIEITVPPAPSQPGTPPPPEAESITQGLPRLEPAPLMATSVLPVPDASLPLGNTRNQPKPIVSNVVTPTGSPPPPPTMATALGLRYRVVVEADNASKQAKVRSLVPGAFRTFSQGKVYMQVGAFSDRAKADEIMQTLTSNGLKGVIEQL